MTPINTAWQELYTIYKQYGMKAVLFVVLVVKMMETGGGNFTIGKSLLVFMKYKRD